MQEVKRLSYPLNIQLFADEGEGEGQSGTDGGNPTGGTGTKEPTLKELLSANKAIQSEYDKMITKSLETAKEKWEKESEDRLNQKLSEADKLAKMNKEEKDNYQKQVADKQLKDREAQITRRELQATAKETLIEKGLSPILADILNYENADSVQKSIEHVKDVFEKAVKEQVASVMKQNAVPGRSQTNDSSDVEHWKKLSGIKTK